MYLTAGYQPKKKTIESGVFLKMTIIKNKSRLSGKTSAQRTFSSSIALIEYLTALYNLGCGHDIFFSIQSSVSIQNE